MGVLCVHRSCLNRLVISGLLACLCHASALFRAGRVWVLGERREGLQVYKQELEGGDQGKQRFTKLELKKIFFKARFSKQRKKILANTVADLYRNGQGHCDRKVFTVGAVFFGKGKVLDFGEQP